MGQRARRVWSRTDCFSSFKKGRARGGSGEGKGNKKSYTTHFQQEAASASRGPDRHPSWVAQGGGESSEASLDPGAVPGSGNRISGRSRQRRPRGSSERNCNNPGQTAFVLSHFFRASGASPVELAQAGSRRGDEGGRGAARPTRKKLPRSLDSESARMENKLPS